MSSSTKRKEDEVVFRISMQRLSCICCSLPLFGFLACVGTSLYLHFEGATATHCGVRNYLPSISAAIGGFTPEKYIWRICIGLHCAPRYMMPFMYYRYFQNSMDNVKQKFAFTLMLWTACLSHVIEISSLVGLTFISSSENRGLHENLFISFMVFSLLFMLIMCILMRWCNQDKPENHKDRRSQKYKTILFLVNILSFLASVYFFIRHNSKCEPGVYTIFAFLEYVIVVTNIAFHHACVVLDFGEHEVYVAPISMSGRSEKMA
ncbi:post-GPI attachment to proteins factor 2 isoform X2 [Lingula anatina]|uniref:Post-GPI attachment to proteins factor 2 isoform X2 n=1 Tax=Lingula anatina TaxID=7574 RepID=A0A1S3HX03_LINAN|nr:post-GPI attachment to proteins factor 2 isoform X2 [Lingula anatina]|eukprot:XP_013390572.1 post-GPI attachment to proteins factor 2 isoform X2 [Lingula anatina]